MAHFVKNITVAAGSTVGLFASLSTSAVASNVHFVVPSTASVYLVHDSSGAQPYFPVPNAPFNVGAAEVWLKNTGNASAVLAVRCYSLA